ncbi:MAG: aminotransferase class I/II-fold pyridoxal phosphate-dependent enzyme [Bdellovibrionia bacterium]
MGLEQRLRDVQHFGEEGGVVPAIDLAATSTFLNPEEMEATFAGQKEGCYLYSRHSNPTVEMFGKKMAALENTEAAVGVASGISAIATALEQIFFGADSAAGGGEMISSQTVYGGTYALFKNIFPKQGIQVRFVNTEDIAAVEGAITPQTKVIYTETLSNPLLSASPLRELKKLAVRHNLKLVVDNTFTPCIVTPADLGADVVIHSATKYLSGASDMIAGVICGNKKFIESLRDLNHGCLMLKGAVMDPKIAHELYLRLDHLPLRMKAHSQSAQFLAKSLAEKGLKVIYPGLNSHPHHQLLKSMQNSEFGFGGMMAIEFESSDAAMRVAQRLQEAKFGLYAVSLGFSRTLMTVPAVTTSSEITEEDQQKMNLSKGLLRLSIGYMGEDQELLKRFLACL